MNWSNSLYSMEIVIHIHFSSFKISSHNLLCLDRPWWSFHTFWICRVNKTRSITSWLHIITTLQFHTINKWFKKFLRITDEWLDLFIWILVTLNWINKRNHSSCDLFMSFFFLNFWLKIIVNDSTWKHRWVHKAWMRYSRKCNNWEFVLLFFFNIFMLMPESFCTSSDS